MKLLWAVSILAMLSRDAQAQPRCEFNLTAAPSEHTTVIAREPVLSRVRVLEQSGSPVEIVAADVNGLALRLTDDGYSYHTDAPGGVDLRNRSDQHIEYVLVAVLVGSCEQIGSGGSVARPQRLALAPGSSAHLELPFGSGGGITQGANPTNVFVWVSKLETSDCMFQPAVAAPCSRDR